MAVEKEVIVKETRPVPFRPEDTGYNPPPAKPIQPTTHKVPPTKHQEPSPPPEKDE